MLFGRRSLAVRALTALFAVSAAGAGAQVATPDTAGPTAIEQALIEHSCSAIAAASTADTDPYRECLSSRLRSMRDDFGRDLSRLSPSERLALDSACSSARVSVGREAYLDCLRDQLVSLRDRWNRANPAVLVVPPLPDPASPLAVGLVAPAGEASSSPWGLWLGVGFVTLVVAAGGALLAVKSRRTVVRKCGVCGNDVPGSGDFCPTCRHDAAEALRRTAIERADHERAQAEEQRRQHEQEEEHRRLKALEEEEEARRRQQEEARRQEEGAPHHRKEEEELRPKNRAVVAPEEVFDPYAILSVPRDASIEAIDAAYQEARLKYSQDQVAHLGAELQEHYRRKAEAVDRAYLMLIG